MMRPSILFVYALPLLIAIPALAMDANTCIAESAQLEMSKRDAYIKSCLDKVSAPDNVKKAELQQKRALCEQNAKNHKLQGNDKASYLETCMNKNEAAMKGMAANVAAKAEGNQEKIKKDAAKTGTAQNRAGAKAKPKAKPKSKPKSENKAKATRDGSRETAQ